MISHAWKARLFLMSNGMAFVEDAMKQALLSNVLTYAVESALEISSTSGAVAHWKVGQYASRVYEFAGSRFGKNGLRVINTNW